MKSLGEIVTTLKGQKATEVFDKPQPGAYRYLQIDDLRPDAIHRYARDDSGVLATEEDVLIVWDGANAGTVGFGLEGYAGSTLAILRPKTKDIFAPYLGYFLSGKFQYLHDTHTGATIPHVNRDALEQLRLNIPALPEQRCIASRLDKADRLRRLRRYALDLGETYLQSVFLEMFGDPVRNEKKWPIGELEEMCTDVIDCPHATPKYAPEPTPYACVRSSDIQNGYFDWSTTLYVAESEYKERIARTVPVPNDVVYCREGARFGNAARILEGQLVCLGQRTMLFRANPEVATPEFIWAFLESKSTYNQAVKWAGGSASPHVNVQDIKAFHTVKPPLALQEKFAGVVRRYDRLRAQQRESLRQAEMLFGAMLEGSFRPHP